MDFRTRPVEMAQDALLVPGGSPLYESLTCKFVAFDRMLAALGEAAYSGYVRLIAPGVDAILLLREGSLIDVLYREGQAADQGEPALRAVERLVGRGEGVLDIVSLPPDLVSGLHHLASGTSSYPELYASWVNISGLVDFLKTRQFTGSLTVQAKADSGVLLFVAGEITGSFTKQSRDVGHSAEDVSSLCKDPEARIFVRTAPEVAAEPAPRSTSSWNNGATAVGAAVSDVMPQEE